MTQPSLWKYCTKEHCNEFLLSFRLLVNTDWPPGKQLACLYAVSNHIEKHYHSVAIFKGDGSSRTLQIPDSLLKTIQTNIHRNILRPMSVSPYATAYHEGADIRINAAAHAGKMLVLKMDVENFFDSITFLMVYQRAFPTVYFPPAVGTLLTHLCCYRECLPQGAPTSPAISNLIMRPFDDYMGRWCNERDITYTRYCDDMTFSGNFDAKEVKNKVQNYLQAMGFSLNHKKTSLSKRYQRQTVTSIVVNQNPQVSREYRRKLRQEIHYCLKFGVASHLEEDKVRSDRPLSVEVVQKYLVSLLGKIDYVLHINPQDTAFRQAKAAVQQLLKNI
jgi:retron-type reverse transcriptase